MKFLLYIFVVISAVASILAWGASGIGTAGSLIGASMLAWYGGSGLRACLHTDGLAAKLSGAVLGSLFFFAAHWLSTNFPFVVGVFRVQLGGGAWWLIGAVICFLATSKADTASHSTE